MIRCDSMNLNSFPCGRHFIPARGVWVAWRRRERRRERWGWLMDYLGW